MRRTRARYYYALRQVRRDQDDIVRQRMADALINDSSRSFWSEVKRIRNSNTGTSLVVDGCSDKVKISQVFLRKYRVSAPYDVAEMQEILTDVESQLSREAALSFDHICSPQEVASAISNSTHTKMMVQWAFL